MYGSLEITSTFAPVGWLIVALAVSALAALYAQRDDTGTEPTAPVGRTEQSAPETVRWAA
jgi:hypothetical protein